MAPPRGVWRRKSVGSRHRGAGFAVFLRVRSAGGALRCAEVWVAPARRGGGGWVVEAPQWPSAESGDPRCSSAPGPAAGSSHASYAGAQRCWRALSAPPFPGSTAAHGVGGRMSPQGHFGTWHSYQRFISCRREPGWRHCIGDAFLLEKAPVLNVKRPQKKAGLALRCPTPVGDAAEATVGG